MFTMNFFNLIHQTNFNLRKIYRNLEKIKIKLIKRKWSKIFNQTCLTERILPNYTRIELLNV